MNTAITDLSAVDMSKLIRARQLSAAEVLEAHLAKIDRVNPVVNAIVTLDIDGARTSAAAADEHAAAGGPLGRLHGLPIAFKDTHRTAGMRTTFGSKLFQDNVPNTNDEVVRRIVAAGAVRIGKTNVPEMAAGSHTFNSVFGVTRNPYGAGRSAGGSSGGAAAALAARMQPIADGSDMGGSLRNPASFCNVVGLRPTPGVVPAPEAANGFSPLAVAGPMGRTIDDVALLLSVLSGPHRYAPLRAGDVPVGGNSDTVPLETLRIAWAPTLGDRVPVDPEVSAVLNSFVTSLSGHSPYLELACPNLDGADDAFRVLRAAEFDHEWGDLLAENVDMFKADLAWNIRQGLNTSGREVVRAQAEVTRLHRCAADFFDKYDVLLAPVSPVAPFNAELAFPPEVDGIRQDDYLEWMRASYLFTPLGVPALSLPAGFTDVGLPVGIQVITAARTEHKLLQIARALEAAFPFSQHLPVL
ncbi:amidase [Rhodococcus sp. NPDC060176]|uniref:amidase n=1 Tax=Rhodococcus sp. NPDC060176 TaxID=3347062 RepID=UPI00366778B3